MSDGTEDLEGIDGLPQPIDPEAGAEPEGPQLPEWAEGLDPDLAGWLQNKNFRDPATALRSAYEAEQRATRAEQERQALMEGLLSAQDGDDDDWEDEGYDTDPGQQIDPIAMAERIGRAIDEGRVDTATGMRDAIGYAMNSVIQAMQQEFSERDSYYSAAIEPLNSWQQQTALTTAAQNLANQYGAVYDEIKDEVGDMILSDPERFNSPEGIEAAFGIVYARKGPEFAAQMTRRAPEFTSGGARGATRSTSLAAQIVKGIDSAGAGQGGGMKL